MTNLKLSVTLVAVGASSVSILNARSPGDQRVWQSDVRIESLEVNAAKAGGSLNARAVIAADGDDAARSVRVEIMLPIGVGVLRLSDGCKPSPSPVTGLNARVTCDLGEIAAHASREITISTTTRQSSLPLRLGVFAFSDTPDPSPANNFAERLAQ
jgi:hypothetical protein